MVIYVILMQGDKMNTYFSKVGFELTKIRQLLNFNQEDLAKSIGVSRPIIVNIEKDQNKMNKNILLALFSVVCGEIETRKIKIQQIDLKDLNNLQANLKKVGITKNTLQAINTRVTASEGTSTESEVSKVYTAPATLGAILGSFVAGCTIGATIGGATISASEDYTHELAIEIGKLINSAIDDLEKSLAECFSIHSLNMNEFYNKVLESDML